MKKKLISLVLCLAALASLTAFAIPVSAEEEKAAENITAEAEFYCWGQGNYAPLTDSNVSTTFSIGYTGQLVINTETPVAGLYVKFYLQAAVWDLTVNEKSFNRGEDDFLHEYVDIAALAGESTQIIMDFPRGAVISEIEIYTKGKLPDSVQVWEKPLDRADLLLFSSHSDDEQLFFAGVLPYSVAYGARTQVVYFCSHSDTPVRPHEQLNGLWAVGVRNYPVIGIFPDLYSESKEGAERVFANAGYGHEDFVKWQVENLRRFKPQVAIGHDAAGEYGHGTHIVNSETLREAVAIAADPDQYPYLTASYGAWDTLKVYLHLWEENPIVMDFDKPLEYFGGKSAYEMSRLGYGEHNSQHWTWFTDWLIGTDAAPITKAAQIGQYSPCRYGLWRSTVGADTGADFFENIELYSVQEDKEAAKTETPSEVVPEVTESAAVTEGAVSDSSSFPFSPLWIAAGVGALALVILIAVLARGRGGKRPTEPTRAKSQAEKLREAREQSGPAGTTPGRPTGTAQSGPAGTTPGRPTGTAQSRPAGSTPGRPAGTAQSRPAGSTPGRPAGTAQSRPAGSTPGRPAGTAQSRPAGSTPGRADLQAQRLREARERSLAQAPTNARPAARPADGADAPAKVAHPAARPAPKPGNGSTRPAGAPSDGAPSQGERQVRTKPTDKTY